MENVRFGRNEKILSGILVVALIILAIAFAVKSC